MLFHSPEFLLLLLLTLVLFWAMPRLRTPILAAANALFYAASGWEYLLLFLVVAAATYWLSQRVVGPRGRVYLWIGVILNLANLGLFKYTGFMARNLERLLGLGIDPAAWQWVLPVGISFYTFQMIAYLVDVFRGQIPPARRPLDFWVFISFFGQLIAGPIMRGAQFLPQIREMGRLHPEWQRVKYGLFLFTLGMGKKILLADRIGPRADAFFASWQNLNGVEAWVAGWLFAFQIYFDFSAYSEMALGIGHLFGFDLAVNFRTPYLAGNPAEFWRRWHITLSQWIRDYIYIPLGGSRRGEVRTHGNMIIAMALSGLWHGAAWTFVAWGLFHGVLAAGHKLWIRHAVTPLSRRLQERQWPAWVVKNPILRWLSVFLMFQATTVGWIFFRAGSLTVAVTLVRRMLDPGTWLLTPVVMRYLPVLGILAALHLAEFWLRHREADWYRAWRRWVPTPLRAAVYTAIATLLLIMTETEQVSFIYFRF